jgi:hypothetical protein
MADSFQPRFVDLVRNYTSTIGTGNLVLGDVPPGFTGFTSVLKPGDQFYYSVMRLDTATESEVGRGTLLADGSIVREPIGGIPTDFSSGSKSVALVAAAEWFEGVQAGSAAALSEARSRDALAALADPSKPSILHEIGREGLFVFDPSDLSAEVGADTAQGIYIAPASDPSGESGAWKRKHSGPIEVRWFGATGDGVADDKPGIQAAIDYAGRTGGGEVRLGRGTFTVSDIILVFTDDVTIDAREATIVSAITWPAATFYIGGNRGRVLGGTWKITTAGDSMFHFDIEGMSCEIDGARFVKEPEAGGYQGYVHVTAQGFVMRNCTTEGSNGFYCEASDCAFLSNRFKARANGGDDALAIKAIRDVTKNIRVIGNSFENLAYFCSIGSEIGTLGADDPSRSKGVYNVVIEGNIGVNCTGILYIKPGAIGVYDYRDGTVDGVVVSDNILRDDTGAKLARGIAITAARGAQVRNIKGKSNVIVGRFLDTGGRRVAGLDIFIPDLSSVSASGPTISDIDVGIDFHDPYNGASAGTAGTAGSPAGNIAAIARQSATYGTIRNVTVDIAGNGCSYSGISISEGLDDAVFIRRAVLTNAVTDGSSLYGGIQYSSRIRVGRNVSIAMAAGSAAKPYKPMAGTTADIVSDADLAYIAQSIPAGTDSARGIRWSASRNCFIHKVEIASTTNVVKSVDDTNYTQHEIRNESFSGQPVISSSTKATGGQAFPANMFNQIYQAVNLTGTLFNSCFFSRGNALSYTKNDFGNGTALNDAYLRIHWAPY